MPTIEMRTGHAHDANGGWVTRAGFEGVVVVVVVVVVEVVGCLTMHGRRVPKNSEFWKMRTSIIYFLIFTGPVILKGSVCQSTNWSERPTGKQVEQRHLFS